MRRRPVRALMEWMGLAAVIYAIALGVFVGLIMAREGLESAWAALRRARSGRTLRQWWGDRTQAREWMAVIDEEWRGKRGLRPAKERRR